MTNQPSRSKGDYRGVEVNPDLDFCCQAARDIAAAANSILTSDAEI